jgi:isocitrate lyase
MKAMIEAGAAGVHFEDQLSSAKNVDTLVVVPTQEAINKLCSRLAADVMGTPTSSCPTDADAANLTN